MGDWYRQDKIGQRGDRNRWINFRPDPGLDELLCKAAKEAGTSRSAVVRAILREALLPNTQPDTQLETLRRTSAVIRRATDRVLQEYVIPRLPEILKEADAELAK